MSWFSRLTNGLSKTRKGLFFDFPSSSKTSHVDWDSLEFSLISADVGMELSDEIINDTKANLEDGTPFQSALEKALLHQLEPPGIRHKLRQVGFNIDVTRKVVEPKGQVIMVVGVNGVGKTTTIAKLAHYYRNLGRSVMFGAADTFRAAASAQLEFWGDKLDISTITGGHGGDPGAVAFDAATARKANGSDLLLVDTAGRLHTKHNLMEELKKIHRVISKVEDSEPADVWLVLDAITGQNGLEQAKKFHQAIPLTGIIVTKLDGSGKGGVIVPIVRDLHVPIKFIGIGETLDDLQPYDAASYVKALLHRPDHTT
jgi:fused signal recognition particle receptor